MSNTYAIAAVAYDNKDNASKRVQTEMVITGAGIDTNRSSLTLDGQTSLQMLIGDEQAHTLKLSLRDAEGQLVTGLAKFITSPVEFNPVGSVIGRALNRLRGRALTSPVVGDFTEMDNGDYEATVTAGNQADTGKITVSAEGVSKSLNFEVRTTLLDVTGSTFDAVPAVGDVVADGQQTHTLTFTAKDAGGNPVTGDTSLRFVADSADGVTISPRQEQDGVYTATVTSTRAGDITVRAFSNQYQLKDKVVTLAFIAVPADKNHSGMTVSASRVAVKGTVNLTLTLKDKYGNPATTQPGVFQGSCRLM